MRLFLACLLPDAVARDIARETATMRAAVPAVRWVPAERLHLTMKFLGIRPEHDVAAVRDAVASVTDRVRPFDATIGQIGAFPNFSRPRVVWLGMQPDTTFAELAGALDRRLHGLGYALESRPFHAHVTLGRVNGALPGRQCDVLRDARERLQVSWSLPVREVSVVRSTLGAGGARYETLTTLPLGGT
ncbi:MAG: RNA 2',3'-cyclic phosphodiesterase [Gemmatimonadetes bacterium]|nr:RNA 2',3'-cyclic phosphodiesterase [Gemmatimonadota bacterium]